MLWCFLCLLGFFEAYFLVIFLSQEQSEGVFMALGKRYIVSYNAISREERKICKTDGY